MSNQEKMKNRMSTQEILQKGIRTSLLSREFTFTLKEKERGSSEEKSFLGKDFHGKCLWKRSLPLFFSGEKSPFEQFLKVFKKKALTGFVRESLTFLKYMLYYWQVTLSSSNPIICFCATGETMYIETKRASFLCYYFQAVTKYFLNILYPQPFGAEDFLFEAQYQTRVFTPQGVLSPLAALGQKAGAGYGYFLAGNRVAPTRNSLPPVLRQ